MSPSRQEDLDWLYGRDQPQSTAPEPTRVMPTPGSGASTSAAPPLTAQQGPAGYSPIPAYGGPAARAGWGPGGAGPAGAGPGGPTYPGGPGAPLAPAAKPAKRRRLRTVLLISLLAVVLVLAGLVGVPLYAWSHVHRIVYAPAGRRPADQPGTTFLLVGSDSRAGLTKAQQKKLGTGNTPGVRTDTIMIMYIPPSGRPALISVPRDSYVPIPNNGTDKINSAYAFGGAKLLVNTIEQDTGLRIDAYMEIGFGGFVNIIDSLGGIQMCLPNAIKDRDSHLNLPKGCQNLSGTNALGYVRMRKADPRGDLGRVERQRQMLAAVAKKGASPATVLNPVRYWDLSNATADSLTLGQDTSLFQTASMALAMKKVSSGQGLTLTVPVSNPGASTPVGSAVLWDTAKAKAMFADIARGDTSKLDKYAK